MGNVFQTDFKGKPSVSCVCFWGAGGQGKPWIGGFG